MRKGMHSTCVTQAIYVKLSVSKCPILFSDSLQLPHLLFFYFFDMLFVIFFSTCCTKFKKTIAICSLGNARVD